MASLGYTGLTQKRVSRCQKGGAGVGGEEMSLGEGRGGGGGKASVSYKY